MDMNNNNNNNNKNSNKKNRDRSSETALLIVGMDSGEMDVLLMLRRDSEADVDPEALLPSGGRVRANWRRRYASACGLRLLLSLIALALMVEAASTLLSAGVLTADSLLVMRAGRNILPVVEDLVSRPDQILAHVKVGRAE